MLPGLAAKRMKTMSEDWVTTIISSHGIEELSNDTRVVCLSQNVRKLQDPLVRERDSLLVEDEGSVPHLWKGTRLSDFVDGVCDEYSVIHFMIVICYEAFKTLEEDFSTILKSYGKLQRVQKFVHSSRYVLLEILCLIFDLALSKQFCFDINSLYCKLN
jgi:hypothetical protein